ncbi:MAG: BMP family ABC transporter substrate-binding protein [Clostridia bacterium]|nr:BMP family ABC transporter substrate-binding protein [Clostridia bacterium]MBR0445192.1 BMP family ABC transporter substrate-binding protein [Clostridia bacterium]
MISSNTIALDEYVKAQRMGQKEKKELEALGMDPFPAVLDEVFPDVASASVQELPVSDVPADRIVGTKAAGRTNAFSASFLPLPDPGSEFAIKWKALCTAHLSDVGIRDPIECVEYLGNFYVVEGNKRVSVLRYFGAVRIPARVTRVLPSGLSDPQYAAYQEFVEFQKATGIWDIQFKKPGDYSRLLSAIGKKPGEMWTVSEKRMLISTYYFFKQAFNSLGGMKQGREPEEALLLFLKVYSYEALADMSRAELRKALSGLWGDVKAVSEPETIKVETTPADDDKVSVIQKLIFPAPKHLSVAFVYEKDPDSSPWTKGHAEGAEYLAEALSDSVTVNHYFHADSGETAEEIITKAVSDGAELVFTTTPPMLDATLRAAVTYPRARFFNCSACQPLSSVKSYYCRTYEGKFITGVIAGALAENDLVGYVGSYPILGVPASINAFALGVRMTNPRARILLEWTCMNADCIRTLREKGVRVISNRDIPVPDANYLKHGQYGTFLIGSDGELEPLASPCWLWGKLYENIVHSVLSGSAEKKDQAVNYWWGMDSGVIDVTFSEQVPSGVRTLAETLMDMLKKGQLDPFGQRLAAQDGSLISDGETPLSSMEILKMDRLAECVEGFIPEYDEIFPMSRALVRELGVHRDRIPPETEDAP